MPQWWQVLVALTQVPGSVPSTHKTPHNHLDLQFQEVWCPPVTTPDIRHTCDAHSDIQAKHTHSKKIHNLKIMYKDKREGRKEEMEPNKQTKPIVAAVGYGKTWLSFLCLGGWGTKATLNPRLTWVSLCQKILMQDRMRKRQGTRNNEALLRAFLWSSLTGS